MFFSRCPYRGHEAKVAQIFLAPIGVTDSEGVKNEVSTRPDLAYIVSVLSQFSEMPDESHWNRVKRVFRYLNGTTDHSIIFYKSKCLSVFLSRLSLPNRAVIFILI